MMMAMMITMMPMLMLLLLLLTVTLTAMTSEMMVMIGLVASITLCTSFYFPFSGKPGQVAAPGVWHLCRDVHRQ